MTARPGLLLHEERAQGGPLPPAGGGIEPPGWYVLCRAAELGKKPLAVRIGERHLVAFRTAQGAVAALDDRCAHRGMPLSAGRVDGERVRCPYHGWEYDRHGAVRHVPALQHAAVDCSAWRVGSLACVEQDGYVWALLGTSTLAAPHRFLHKAEPGWTTFTMKTLFRSGVEACLENFLDCPHATFVHEHWFRANTARPVDCAVRTLADGAAAEFFDEPREKSAVWWLLAPSRGKMRHVDRFIAPNISEVEYEFANGLHYVITSACTPHDRETTLVHTVISFRYPGLRAAGAHGLRAAVAPHHRPGRAHAGAPAGQPGTRPGRRLRRHAGRPARPSHPGLAARRADRHAAARGRPGNACPHLALRSACAPWRWWPWASPAHWRPLSTSPRTATA